ncbi:MAG: hypothetical protein J7J82_03830 [Staphylothermus sp.]|nr:hypothetical protein [Staphylothermus sp.]
MDGNTAIYLFLLVAIIAGLSTIQFYKGRKQNLKILEYSIRVLEKSFKPRDKNYTVIGIYIGYDATYKVIHELIKNIKAVVLLLPRQSLLYMPIAKLTSRFDKIFLVINYKKEKNFPGEAHLIKKGYYRLGVKRAIKDIEKMRIEKINIGTTKYYLVYTHRSLVEKLINFAKQLEDPSIINHIAIVPRKKRLYLAARLVPDRLEELTTKFYKLGLSL